MEFVRRWVDVEVEVEEVEVEVEVGENIKEEKFARGRVEWII